MTAEEYLKGNSFSEFDPELNGKSACVELITALTAVEMARKEMIEKAVEHLRRNLCNYFDASREDYDKFIEDFKIVINEKL